MAENRKTPLSADAPIRQGHALTCPLFGEPTPLETGGSGGPGVWIAALAGKRSEGTDHDQHARAIFLQAHIEVDGVGPQVNVALAVQVALRPGLELLLPDLLESHDVIRR